MIFKNNTVSIAQQFARMKSTAYRFILILILPTVFSSCAVLYEAVGNSMTVFDSPEKVKSKVQKVYSDSVSLSALWVGHSTVLLQMGDKLIITDPVFTETIGLVSKRAVEPGINLNKVPFLDLILVSHPHIDHLSLGSLQMLSESFPRAPLVFPNGVENFLPGYDLKMYRLKNNDGYSGKNFAGKNFEGSSVTVNGIRVSAVTANHWGGRYGLDGFIWKDISYTGFIIEYNNSVVFFAGDTGYDSTAFKKIGEKYKIDLALIPIGPCDECEGLGNARHVFPEGAIRIFMDLKAGLMIPIHYGVFQFRFTDVNTPVYKLRKLIQDYGISDKVKELKIGEQVIIK